MSLCSPKQVTQFIQLCRFIQLHEALQKLKRVDARPSAATLGLLHCEVCKNPLFNNARGMKVSNWLNWHNWLNSVNLLSLLGFVPVCCLQ